MSLDATRLAAALKSNIIAQLGAPDDGGALLTKFCTAVATSDVAEITGHAVVPALAAGSYTSPAGSVTGNSAPGTVT